MGRTPMRDRIRGGHREPGLDHPVNLATTNTYVSRATAPAANPNMASEIAMNAKWYHIVTLKIRVRNSSSCNNERVVKNKPA